MEPITDEEFPAYWKYSVTSWIKDMSNAGLMSRDIPYEEAESEVRKFIPEGLHTPGHFFFYLVESGTRVGKIWFELRNRRGMSEAYLWDIFIIAEHRGKGFGKARVRDE